MKKTPQTVMSFLVAFAMVAAPVADAQTRGRQGSGQTTNQQRPTSGSTTRPSATGNTRPSTGGTRPSTGSTNRPATGNNTPTYRPGNTPGSNNNNRPATGGNNRPGTGTTGNFRPSNPPAGPSGWNRPGSNTHRPGNGFVHPGVNRPTPPPRPISAGYRHPVPFFGSFRRPVPPPRWHYTGGGPVFGTILGVALGTAIGASLTSLANSGYTVSNYGNDVVYLTNVPQMNYTWPDAALYYTNGILTGSQFTYTSPYYDMSRYNNLYNVFTSQYGLPIQSVNQGGIISTTWYGPDNRYVSLSFNSQYGGNYYTTLSFGN